MNKKQIIGMILFMVYLFISIVDFISYLGAGSVTTIEQLIAIIDMTAKLSLISKLLVLGMFGIIFLVEDD